MFERLLTALAPMKTDNTSENLFNEFRKSVHYLYRDKEITKQCIKI